MRTPAARDVQEAEDREWADALRQKRKRAEAEDDALQREREKVGWKYESGKPATRRSVDSAILRSSRVMKGLTTRGKAAATHSPAVKSLASKLLLNSAVKRDPFGGSIGSATSADGINSTRQQRQDMEGKVGVKRRRSE